MGWGKTYKNTQFLTSVTSTNPLFKSNGRFCGHPDVVKPFR